MVKDVKGERVSTSVNLFLETETTSKATVHRSHIRVMDPLSFTVHVVKNDAEKTKKALKIIKILLEQEANIDAVSTHRIKNIFQGTV